MTRFSTLVLLSLSVALARGGAQVTLPSNGFPPLGTRIRVHQRSSRYTPVGELVRVSADTLVVLAHEIGGRGEAPWAVPLSDLAGVDVKVGSRHPVVRGALIGLVAGAGAGAILGYAVPGTEEWCGPSILILSSQAPTYSCGSGELPRRESATIVGFLGGIVGLGIGAAVGTTLDPDRWSPIDLRAGVTPRIGIAPNGRWSIGLGISTR